MRDLAFFDKRSDYQDFIFHDIFGREPSISEHPFYRNLIQFVIDKRSPIFYHISHPSEHFAFSGAYHFETIRERYPNPAREALFWLHDFTHLLFPYPHDLWGYSESAFHNTFTYQERAASNETEIFAYYRVPGLRGKVFPDEKLYFDILWERDVRTCPEPRWMWDHRNKIVVNDEFGEEVLGEYPDILAWFRSWRTLTPKFCNQRYRSMAGIRVPKFDWRRLYLNEYEKVIKEYKSEATQDDYQNNILANLAIAYAILGWEDPPIRWRHAPDAIASLEGAVFFQR